MSVSYSCKEAVSGSSDDEFTAVMGLFLFFLDCFIEREVFHGERIRLSKNDSFPTPLAKILSYLITESIYLDKAFRHRPDMGQLSDEL